ncbi:MAG: hypothetical protein KAI02_01930 [Gammaproteobacteria bacterium]|nr:hypothetical protein [Gammaproteobacteria bacterium]
MSKSHFSSPGYYQITVEGTLPSLWFNRLGAMHVTVTNTMTIMQGRVSDQADLSGILNSLYELHLTLLSVQFIDHKISSKDDMIQPFSFTKKET